ncbi:winged helix-turn-helix transcriptional regulator [Haloplanus sp. C73]|uniref:winged helix-turn-helix transcriptional regulator n=1 Tax=Haloplanus sp. C73 TaxID=3421641 RepID=UPI003EBD3C56
MTDQRDRIYRHIDDHPGIHFNELGRELDLATGQLQYHLGKLRRDDAVVAESLYGRTHYYTPEYDAWERGAVAVMRRETARDVLLYLAEAGASSPQSVADALEIARSTLEWHADHLHEQALVEKRRDERGRVTLALADPEETAALLRTVEPSVPDRLVDRFTRLVDTLVE